MITQINGEDFQYSAPTNPEQFDQLVERGVPIVQLVLVCFARKRLVNGRIHFSLWTVKRLRDARDSVGADMFVDICRDVFYDASMTKNVSNPIGLIVHRCRQIASRVEEESI